MPKTNSKKKAKAAVEETEKWASIPTRRKKKISLEKLLKKAGKRLREKFPGAEISVQRNVTTGGTVTVSVPYGSEIEELRKLMTTANSVPIVTAEYNVEIEWPNGTKSLAKATVPVDFPTK